MSKTISISNHKGGVGKTTSTINIGKALSLLKKRVLLIDLDPQANLTQSMGLIDEKKNIYGSLRGEYELEPVVKFPLLSLIPSTLDLSAAEIELSIEPGREYILKELIKPVLSNYDYVLIDCPPSLGLLTLNALSASNEILIPLQAQYLALQGLTKHIEIINKIKKRLNKELKICGVFITQFNQRKILNRDIAESIQTYFEGNVFNTRIRDNISLAEAPSQGVSIFDYDSKSKGAEDYMNLCKEILDVHSNL